MKNQPINKEISSEKIIVLQKEKSLFKAWWIKFEGKPRYEQILWSFAAALIPLIIIGVVLYTIFALSSTIFEKIIATNGFWNLVTLMISSPIAFFVWKFRDENTALQLENQRKDVNLKEFQKIAEWVSGLHLVEDKVIEKTKHLDKSAGDSPSDDEISQMPNTFRVSETEISHEYCKPGQSRHIPSHSRQDGAVGLQVAAVYMLKPFYCGEHGDGFRKPALNLLTSSWLALFKQVEKDKGDKHLNQELDPNVLKKSPLAIALTEVLLADGGDHLCRHPEVFPNLYLPYLNVHLPGLDKEKVLQLFADLDCRGINLEQAKLNKVKLNNVDLSHAKLTRADFSNAELNGAKLRFADLNEVELYGANLNGADLTRAIMPRSGLLQAELNGAKLYNALLSRADLCEAKLRKTNLKRAYLSKANLSQAMLYSADLRWAILDGVNLDGANLYLANLRNSHFDIDTTVRGALFDTENIKVIRRHLDQERLSWVIQAPHFIDIFTDKKFSFERDELVCTHELPASLTIDALQALNPAWTISLVEESADTNLL